MLVLKIERKLKMWVLLRDWWSAKLLACKIVGTKIALRDWWSAKLLACKIVGTKIARFAI